MGIHKLDTVHQDFYPGNILSPNFKTSIQISDFVLIGEEYIKAADVYSFGIIAYEIVTGFPPYSDIPHYKDSAMKICNGLRPKIPFYIPRLIVKNNYEVLGCSSYSHIDPPTFEELRDEFREYYRNYGDYFEGKNKDSIGIRIKKAEEFSANQESPNTTTRTPHNYQTHPQEFIPVDFLTIKSSKTQE
ncbi:hypothetical protein Glove_320g125 [Diversispora epigaea]|uniref:Protein kinase domain-containing protein n=1 Tax=Diversispora epigaea TaxID=1348612 RepID=A0A397HS30_9GLOM|nr:hypothetical protein Glove_320g125 [Diversispora epigaea]